jgi:hypothetical protein
VFCAGKIETGGVQATGAGASVDIGIPGTGFVVACHGAAGLSILALVKEVG